MLKPPEEPDPILAELERIGLNWRELDGLAVTHSEQLLAHLRSLKPGSTWHDALPDLPPGWTPGEESERAPYSPLGPFDYQELPTGPVVHIYWDRGQRADLEVIVGEARDAGWPVYSAGVRRASNPDWPHTDAFIILQRGTSEERFDAFVHWLDARESVSIGSAMLRPLEWYVR